MALIDWLPIQGGTNSVEQEGVMMDFVGDLVDESKVSIRPLYNVTAKGDVADLRAVIGILSELGEIAPDRANALLRFLPESGSATVEIPYKQAVPLQRFLLGWSGALQRILAEYTKKGSVKVKKDPNDPNSPIEEISTSQWSDIQTDVSIQAARESMVGKFLTSISFGNYGGIGLTEAEWDVIVKDVSALEANEQALKAIGAGAGKALVKLAEIGVKGAGSLINKATEELAKRAQLQAALKKFAFFLLGGLALLTGVGFFIKWVFTRRVEIDVNREERKALKGKGQR